MLTVKMC